MNSFLSLRMEKSEKVEIINRWLSKYDEKRICFSDDVDRLSYLTQDGRHALIYSPTISKSIAFVGPIPIELLYYDHLLKGKYRSVRYYRTEEGKMEKLTLSGNSDLVSQSYHRTGTVTTIDLSEDAERTLNHICELYIKWIRKLPDLSILTR